MSKCDGNSICSLIGSMDISKLASKDFPVEEQKLDPYVKKLFATVFTGMSGRYTRLKIIKALIEEPSNINQLSRKLGMDYKGIQHNIKILHKNNLIDIFGEGHIKMYFVSDLLMKNIKVLDVVLKKADIKLNKKKTRV